VSVRDVGVHSEVGELRKVMVLLPNGASRASQQPAQASGATLAQLRATIP
jgi:hypothetical protein